MTSRCSLWCWMMLFGLASAAGASELLRNDAIHGLNPASPALATIFTGGASGCSADPSVTLDASDPSNCANRTEGEGAAEAGNGSSDSDDFYVASFDASGGLLDPGSPLLSDVGRPLMFWQLAEACGSNALRAVKDVGAASVRLFETCATAATGACCDGFGGCSQTTAATCALIYRGDGTSCGPGASCELGACCERVAAGSQACINIISDGCHAPEIWMGGGWCATPGMCCNSFDGSCRDTVENCCGPGEGFFPGKTCFNTGC